MSTGDETPPPEEHESPSRTALVVDDDDGFRRTLEIWLEDDGWTVLEATDGREGLERLDRTVDVLAVDRRMPILSGDELVERVSTREFDGAVVVLSADRPDEYLDEALVDAYLQKPVDRVEVLEALAEHE